MIGTWFGYFTIGYQILHSFISSTIVYLIVRFAPLSVARKIVFVFSMAYIMISHIYRMYVDYMGWTLDFTGIQMLLTMKHIMFAFDVYDGTLPESELVHPSHVKTRLTRMPSLLEYYGYIYFFSSFLAGPVFWLREYLAFIDMSLFAEQTPDGSKQNKTTHGKIPPGSFQASMLRLGYALLVAIEVVLQGYFPLRYVTTAEFARKPFLYKLWYQWLSASLIRGTYYFAWLLAEGSHILIGIGFNGYETLKDGTVVTKWDRASNVRVLALELAQNFREATNNWNICTSEKWLKNYVYFRLQRTKLKRYAVHITFAMSAFWHGFYPGYYLSFGVAIIATNVAREIFRKVRPHFVTKDEDGKERPKSFKIVYDIVGIVATNWMLTYIFSSFALLSLSDALAMYKAVHFVGHIVLLLVGGIVSLLPNPPRRSLSEKNHAMKEE